MGNISLTPSVCEALTQGYSLTNQELLSTLFGEKIAEILLTHFPDFQALAQAGIAELKEIAGVGEKKAAQVKAIVEFSRRIYQKPMERGSKFTSSRDVFNAYGSLLKGRLQESFWVLLLDSRNRVIKHVQVSEGMMGSCPVDPKDVFRTAIKEGAISLILLHNHPSGDPEPSQEDKALTEKLKEIGNLFGIRVLDHLVVADNDYVSFADRFII
jgi:DNA repair protein RadC